MSSRTFKGFATNLALKRVEDIVNAHSEPELVKAVMFAYGQNGAKLGRLRDALQVPWDRILSVANHLNEAGLLLHPRGWDPNFKPEQDELTGAGLIEGIDAYFRSNLPFGGFDRDTLYFNTASGEKVIELLEQLKLHAEITYTFEFSFPHALLEKVKDRTHTGIEILRAAEAQVYHAAGIPQGFKLLPTFVSQKVDSQRKDQQFGVSSSHWIATGPIEDPREALELGVNRDTLMKVGRDFHYAQGFLRTSKSIRIGDTETTIFPETIRITNEGAYYVRLLNSRYATAEQIYSFELQQELAQLLPRLKRSLEIILGKGFGQYESAEKHPLVQITKAITNSS
jgi:hypothetical protein